MRKLLWILSCLAVGGLVLGCGGGDNDCDKAASVIGDALDQACAAKDEETCCMCKCWNDGHKSSTEGTECVCNEPTEEACEGDTLDQAKACLADEATCKSQMAAVVEFACP